MREGGPNLDLQSQRSDRTMARDRPSPYGEGDGVFYRSAGDRFFHRPTEKRPVFYRSAGACPPRALECANNGEGLSLALRRRGVFYRARPDYGEDVKSLRVI